MVKLFKINPVFVVAMIFVLIPLFIAGFEIGLEKVGVMNPFSRDYKITGAQVDIEIANTGLVSVHEDINYLFKGCYRQVYRDLEIPVFESVFGGDFNRPTIIDIGGYCEPECITKTQTYGFIGDFGQICDRDAKFIIDFNVSNGVFVGSDVAEFHYQIWGKKWDKPLDELKGEIILPQDMDLSDVKVYFNPIGVIDNYELNDNVLSFFANRFDSYVEVRLLMPKEAFNDGEYIYKNTALKEKDSILIQENYARKFMFVDVFTKTFFLILIITLFIVPYYIFKKYGKEQEIDYQAIYEREPVKGLKPYVINSLTMGNTGDTDNNAITATIMDLVRRGHIIIEETKRKTLFGLKDDIELIFVSGKNNLTNPEKILVDYFISMSENKKLVWSKFLDKLKIQKEAIKYVSVKQKFEESVDKEYDINKYFDGFGNKLFKGFIAFVDVIAIFVGIGITNFVIDTSNYPALILFSYIAAILGIYTIIGLSLNSRVFGHFTKEGFEIYSKSINFKNFMTDMTLLKQYPPKSIIIWEEQLIYATLFGVADKVIKYLKINQTIDDNYLKNNSMLYPLYNAKHLSLINSSFATAQMNSSKSSGGSGGGFGGGSIGGGFGGGGGGAR